MPAATILFGILLIAYGIFTFIEAIHKSPTAAMPAYFGVVFLILGLVASQKEKLRKHAMHAAVAIALIGTVGGLVMGGSKIPALFEGGPTLADGSVDHVARNKAKAQNVLALWCLMYVGLGVYSFVQARLARKSTAAETPSPQVPK
jgi:hypothetical protein